MSTSFIHLCEGMFSEKEKILVEHGSLKAYAFRYETGVSAIRLVNSRGSLVILPFQGQQIWSAEFDGRTLTMLSMFDQPRSTTTYLENYGGFLIHCGATAMGVPAAGDTHPLHGELPNAHYQKAFLHLGEDSSGLYIALGGTYQHTVAFNFNYTAEPLVTLRENSTLFTVDMTITNLKNSPMPLMYLAHANFRPINHGKLVYSAMQDARHVRVRTSIPSHVHPLPGYKEFLDELQENPQKHNLLIPGLGFDPEVVFYIDYLTDNEGWAHSLQIHPDGGADYISHRPEQLNKGVRWICRTADQDALGLLLPATAEPEGFKAEEAKGNVRYLGAKEKFQLNMVMGSLDQLQSSEMEKKISSIISSME